MADLLGTFTPVKKISLQEAIQDWEKENEPEKIEDRDWVDLTYKAISDLDSKSLERISKCIKLSLSTNFISKIPELHFERIEILSLGRNKIKTIRGLEYIGQTLIQLWISYNEIDKLDGLKNLVKLKVLYIGCNDICKLSDLDAISNLPLNDVVFQGNPFTFETLNAYETKPAPKDKNVYIQEIKSKLPSVTMIDGEHV